MRSLLVADRAFSGRKSRVLTEDTELTFLCVCGSDAGGTGTGFGTGLGQAGL